MKITVITPFYEGNKYMDDYVDCIIAAKKNLENEGHELEVILVNDSPWKTLEAPSKDSQFIKIITNANNKGIHYSRVEGLKASTGEYIMFLDQDDAIEADSLSHLLKRAIESKADIVVANANLQQSDGTMVSWYRTDYHKSLIGDLQTYLTIGIQIISPGQCLIKKTSIPDYWKEHLVKVNGADDYYLWLLMLAKNIHFVYLDECLYTHKYTGTNISADTTATDDSVYDFIELLQECDYFKNEDAFTLHEMITYKNQFRSSSTMGKITCSLANLGLFIKNVQFKRKTDTGLGFNRG